MTDPDTLTTAARAVAEMATAFTAEADRLTSERDKLARRVEELEADLLTTASVDPEKFVIIDFYSGDGAYAASIGDKDGGRRITSSKASPGTTIRRFKVRAGDVLDALRSYARKE